MIETVLTFLQNVAGPICLLATAVFFWYKRDKRKTLAETEVAERTVGVDVNAREASGLGASVAFVQEAFRVERESLDRQNNSLKREVKDLEHEVQELRAVIRDRDEQIAGLRSEVAELKHAVQLLKSMTERFTQSDDPR